MVTGKVMVNDELGIHLRPAGLIAEEGLKHSCKIELCHDGRKVNGKSLLSILSLGVRKGYEVEVCCDGVGEEKALKAIIGVISAADELSVKSST